MSVPVLIEVFEAGRLGMDLGWDQDAHTAVVESAPPARWYLEGRVLASIGGKALKKVAKRSEWDALVRRLGQRPLRLGFSGRSGDETLTRYEAPKAVPEAVRAAAPAPPSSGKRGGTASGDVAGGEVVDVDGGDDDVSDAESVDSTALDLSFAPLMVESIARRGRRSDPTLASPALESDGGWETLCEHSDALEKSCAGFKRRRLVLSRRSATGAHGFRRRPRVSPLGVAPTWHAWIEESRSTSARSLGRDSTRVDGTGT